MVHRIVVCIAVVSLAFNLVVVVLPYDGDCRIGVKLFGGDICIRRHIFDDEGLREEYRRRNAVRELTTSERGKKIATIEGAVLGYVTPFALFRAIGNGENNGVKQVRLMSERSSVSDLELHKTEAGVIFVFGYVHEVLLAQLDSTGTGDLEVLFFLYRETGEGFRHIAGLEFVGIPVNRISDGVARTARGFGDSAYTVPIYELKIRKSSNVSIMRDSRG